MKLADKMVMERKLEQVQELARSDYQAKGYVSLIAEVVFYLPFHQRSFCCFDHLSSCREDGHGQSPIKILQPKKEKF